MSTPPNSTILRRSETKERSGTLIPSFYPSIPETHFPDRFGEDSVEKMVDWTVENVPASSDPSILEVGSGNGSLLFALVEAEYTPDRIRGVDYSGDAVKLAEAIGVSKGEGAGKIKFGVCNFLADFPEPLDGNVEERVGAWDLVLDKGTFDAMALAEKDGAGSHPADAYPRRIAQVIKPGGHFLIVCESPFGSRIYFNY